MPFQCIPQCIQELSIWQIEGNMAHFPNEATNVKRLPAQVGDDIVQAPKQKGRQT